MKKLMVLAAMLAMMLAVASPAFAQAVAIDQGDDVEFNGVGQNIIGSVGDISSENNATATSTATSEAEATGDSAAASEANSTADISQDSSVEISQSNEVGNGFWWGWWWW